MIYIAGAEAFVIVALAWIFAEQMRSVIRQHHRERELLLNQIMHLSGRTWAPPPTLSAPIAEEPLEFPEYDAGVLPNY